MPKLQAAVPAGAPPNALLRVRLPDGNEGMFLLVFILFCAYDVLTFLQYVCLIYILLMFAIDVLHSKRPGTLRVKTRR